MEVDEGARALVVALLRAMQRGPDGEDDIVALFSDDAVYVEPFSDPGRPRVHTGTEQIRASFHDGLRWNPPDLRISLDRLDVDGEELVAHWTCTTARLPAPVRGTDRYRINGGRIHRLETRLDE
jgi:ketosteroid isomerase-like protein